MQIEHNRVTHQGQALQNGVRQMLGSYNFTHWLTLNFHHGFSADTAMRCLRLWTMNVQSRMFGRVKGQCFAENPFLFFAFPEDTQKAEPHFHLVVRLAASYFDYFERLAVPMWKKVMRSGTAHLVRIDGDDIDHIKVVNYATKQFSRACSHEHYLTSTMLMEPVAMVDLEQQR
jgi:hypothetical protein